MNNNKHKTLKIISIAILALIIITGVVMICINGLNVGINYSKSIRMDIYLGKTFENEEIKQIAQEVFATEEVLVQKVELFEDMVAVTVADKNIENVDEKIELLNTKLNEKYELENKADEITVTYQPKIKISSIVKPYITSCVVSGIIILIYAIIRFKKIGVLSTILKYTISILGIEALYLSIFAITRMPINNFVIPVGLMLYVLTLTIVTVIQERKLQNYKLEQK